MQERIKQLEDELKRKADPQLTVKLVELSQLKERLRQLEEANRQDQQLIFETYNGSHGHGHRLGWRGPPSAARSAPSSSAWPPGRSAEGAARAASPSLKRRWGSAAAAK